MHILRWLYCYETKSLSALPSGFKSDDQIDFWTNLHEKYLLSKSIPQPSGEGVPGPSDKTLSKLDTSKIDDHSLSYFPTKVL